MVMGSGFRAGHDMLSNAYSGAKQRLSSVGGYLAASASNCSSSALEKSKVLLDDYAPAAVIPASKALYRCATTKATPYSELQKFVRGTVGWAAGMGAASVSFPFLAASASQASREGGWSFLKNCWSGLFGKPRISPPVSQADFAQAGEKAMNALTDSNMGWFQKARLSARAIGLMIETKWQERFGGHHVLPKENRQQLRWLYCNPIYWAKRLFFPHSAWKDEALRGGLAIQKNMQVQASNLNNSAQAAMLRGFRQVLDGAPAYMQPACKLYNWLVLRPEEKRAQVIEDLLSNIKSGSFKDYEPRIKDVLRKAQQQGLPFDEHCKVELLRSGGTIAQVFQLSGKDGKQYILKVARPDINQAYIDNLRPYLLYQAELKYGSSAEGKRLAVEEADVNIASLKEEIQLQAEARNTELYGKALKGLGLDHAINVPTIVAATDHAIVMTKVGEKDFSKIKDEAEFKKNAPPEAMSAFIQDAYLNPNKHTDKHQGNLMPGLNVIDFGRMAAMDTNAHDAMLEMTSKFYLSQLGAQGRTGSMNAARTALRNQEFMESLKTYLSCNAGKNGEWLAELESANPADSQKLQDLVRGLFFRKKLTVTTEESAMPDDVIETALGRKKMETVPTLLNIWGNAVLLTPGTLSGKRFSAKEIADSQGKMLRFTSAYMDAHRQVDDVLVGGLYERICKGRSLNPWQRAEMETLIRRAVANDCTSWNWGVNHDGGLVPRKSVMEKGLGL